jgi:FHS family L-fucose permease-like MFS transporter
MWIYALINILLCGYAILMPNHSGLLALTATSFFMSLMFPTIFALGLRNLGAQAKAGASLLVMAIIGGAVLTALMGWISDLTSIHIAVVVPLICFLVIGLYARAAERT